nr:MAG TPA: hypothetical protein [Caudoviricetes sp.]
MAGQRLNPIILVLRQPHLQECIKLKYLIGSQ